MDAFERLGIMRLLVLDEGALDARFRELSKKAHPDAGGDAEEFEAIRKAYDSLRSPLARLRVALSSLGDFESRGAVPGKVMDLFGPMADGLQAVDQFLGEREKARSGLGKALLDAKMPALKVELESLGNELTLLESDLVGRFSIFDQEGWESSRAEMEEVSRGLAFVTKWQAQTREATGKLFQALLG